MTSEDLTHRAAERTGENIYIYIKGFGSMKKKSRNNGQSGK